MPKIDISSAPTRKGSAYPAPFDQPVAERFRQKLGDAGGITDFGVNLMHLPPGVWSSQRHWHSHEDEMVYIISGEVVLVENGGETVLRAGDCATFPKGHSNGHHLVNRTQTTALFLEIGSRSNEDSTSYSDIDLWNVNDRYVHKDGTPY
ncbi:MAG TPA: cupin domain-containing protein [Kofleriaceae bacterium]